MSDEKEKAVKAFFERKEENSKKKRINNGDLYAGSPMHYYCRHCGAEDIKPEGFIPQTDPIKNPCDACKELIAKGWMPQE